jgi:hypothetical protein
VYLEGRGWVIFDPTPPAGRTTYSRRPGLRALVDTLIMRWNVYVVNYEMRDQLDVIEGTMEAAERGKKTLFSWKGGVDDLLDRMKSPRTENISLSRLGAIGIVMVLAAVLIWLFVRIVFFSSYRRRSGIAGEYDRLVRIVKGKGLRRFDWISHREFADEMAHRWPVVADDVFDVTDMYVAVRFGRRPETDEDITRMRLTVTKIEDRIKGEPRAS